ncbi:MAG: hypothetical protein HYY16_15070 [Planctomycetes bacterium]|nr:hypothetical protein [Planctomycetota bacterium]
MIPARGFVVAVCAGALLALAPGCRKDGGSDGGGGVAGVAAGGAVVAQLEAQTEGAVTPVTPDDDAWYDRGDLVATPLNEAADDLAKLFDPLGGVYYQYVYDRLVAGGRFAIYFGGVNHEKATAEWMSEAHAWMRAVSKLDTGSAVVPAVQLNYRLFTPLHLQEDQWNEYNYPMSFAKGLERGRKVALKAMAAGSRDVWILGHSKGGDVGGNVLRSLVTAPEVTKGIIFGMPWISFRVPVLNYGLITIGAHFAVPWDTLYLRSGMFKFGLLQGTDYQGKLVLFNRYHDRLANNATGVDFNALVDEGHDYRQLWADSQFRQRVLNMMRSPVPQMMDRTAGMEFDWPLPLNPVPLPTEPPPAPPNPLEWVNNLLQNLISNIGNNLGNTLSNNFGLGY